MDTMDGARAPRRLPAWLRLPGAWAGSLLLGLFLWPGAPAAQAQLPGSLDPSFVPTVRTMHPIPVIASQADGKLVIGGSFYYVGTVVSPSVARLNADGSLDTGFVPPAGLGGVVAVAIAPDGKIALVEQIGGSESFNFTVLRLNLDGSADTTFTPTAFTNVSTGTTINACVLAVEADGKILIAGDQINGSIEPLILRFNADGSSDISASGFFGGINCLLPLANGQILVGVATGSDGGEPIFRLNADLSLDATYHPTTGGSTDAFALTLQPDGSLLFLATLPNPSPPSLGGVGGVPRRLKPDGALDTTFSPKFDTNAYFQSLLLLPDGKVLVGGVTKDYTDASKEVVMQNGVVRLNADGSTDTTFKPVVPLADSPSTAGFYTEIDALGLQTNGQVIVGGVFSSFGRLTRFGCGRLNADGSADATFAQNLTDVGTGYGVAVQPGGAPLLIDSACIVDGKVASRLVGFNANGSLHATFQLDGFTGSFEDLLYEKMVPTIAQQADGKVLVTGEYLISPDRGAKAARFNQDGSLDTAFKDVFFVDNGIIETILPQADGLILLAGESIDESQQPYPIFRSTSDGGADSTFMAAADPGTAAYEAPSSTIRVLALQPDGRVLAGGAFDPINGQPSPGVLRFNTDGSVDPSFAAGALTAATAGVTPFVDAVALQPDGAVVVAGLFSAIGGVPCNNVARLAADGSLDTAFNAGGAGTDGTVRSLALQPDGRIILGGEFTQVNGAPLVGVARLDADGSVDAQFDPGTGTYGEGVVYSVALEPDGSVLIAGTFKQFAGQPRDGIARLFGGDVPVPAITSALDASGEGGLSFTYQIAASNHPTSFSAGALPAGLTLNSATGLISGAPTVAGVFHVTIGATNLGGTGTSTLALTLAPGVPVITSAPTAFGQAGVAFTYQIAASFSPGSFAAAILPAGLTVDAVTGVISGVPASAGTFMLVIAATSQIGSGSAPLTLTILPPLPVIASATVATGQVGVAFTYQIAASNNPTNFAAANLPAGLALDAGSGQINGVPAAAGVFSVVISAANPGGSGSATLLLTLLPPSPAIASAPAATGQVGVAFTYQLVASNNPTSFAAANLPAGLTLDSGTGLISGVPAAAGVFSVALSATNPGGSGLATLTLTIAPPLPVVTLTVHTPNVTAGSDAVGEFILSLSAPQTSVLTVHYTIKGTAVNGSDYVLLTGTRKFQPGKTRRPIKIVPLGDLAGAAKKVVKLTLAPGTGYTVGTTSFAKVEILAGPE